MVHCCGFFGHGLMYGPATGKMVVGLVVHGDYRIFLVAERSVSYRAHMEGTGETETMKI